MVMQRYRLDLAAGQGAAQADSATTSGRVNDTAQYHEHCYSPTVENKEREPVAFNRLEKGYRLVCIGGPLSDALL